MKVVDLRIDLLREYENNPRFNDEAVAKVKESIKEFGFKVPIVIDKNNVIISGHTRIKAAKELGLKKVPCIVAEDLSPEQVKAFRLADNKVSEFSTWDEDKLYIELMELKVVDFNIESFGFETKEIDTSTADVDSIYEKFENENTINEVEEDDFDVDEAIENIEVPTTTIGDIWQLGNHRLMCGDSTDKNIVEKLMNNNDIHLLFTDPPYNMGYSGAGIIKETVKNVKERLKNIIDFDALTIEYLSKMNIGSIYIFTSKDLIRNYLNIFKDWKFNLLTWNKTNNPPMVNNNFLPDIEYLLYFHNGNRIWNNGLTPINIYQKYYLSSRAEGKHDAGEDLHPTMKPIKLLSDKLKISSNVNSNVLDLFGGSGSTLIACEQLNRKCFMMELDPKYCDVIIKRWETLTGKKAVLIE